MNAEEKKRLRELREDFMRRSALSPENRKLAQIQAARKFEQRYAAQRQQERKKAQQKAQHEKALAQQKAQHEKALAQKKAQQKAFQERLKKLEQQEQRAYDLRAARRPQQPRTMRLFDAPSTQPDGFPQYQPELYGLQQWPQYYPEQYNDQPVKKRRAMS